MPRFPKSSIRIAALAEDLIKGLARLASELPAPPVSLAQLQRLLDAYNKARYEAIAARTHALRTRAAKDAALKELVEAAKAIIAYAMSMLRGKRDLLAALGWDWPRARRSLQAPGQAYGLHVIEEGRTWIVLGWESPGNGGAVATYQVQRRQDNGPWEHVGSATALKCRLEDQPRGVDLEFQVSAINRAGEGMPSGVAAAVL